MTDIVERLLANYGNEIPLKREAAAEIERLRGDVEYLNNDRAEIEELQGKLEAELYAILCERNALAAEAKAVTAVTDEERRMFSNRLREAHAEIERLRLTPEEAYLQIVEGWLRDNRGIVFTEGAVDDLCQRIARRALEPKP